MPTTGGKKMDIDKVNKVLAIILMVLIWTAALYAMVFGIYRKYLTEPISWSNHYQEEVTNGTE